MEVLAAVELRLLCPDGRAHFRIPVGRGRRPWLVSGHQCRGGGNNGDLADSRLDATPPPPACRIACGIVQPGRQASLSFDAAKFTSKYRGLIALPASSRASPPGSSPTGAYNAFASLFLSV